MMPGEESPSGDGMLSARAAALREKLLKARKNTSSQTANTASTTSAAPMSGTPANTGTPKQGGLAQPSGRSVKVEAEDIDELIRKNSGHRPAPAATNNGGGAVPCLSAAQNRPEGTSPSSAKAGEVRSDSGRGSDTEPAKKGSETMDQNTRLVDKVLERVAQSSKPAVEATSASHVTEGSSKTAPAPALAPVPEPEPEPEPASTVLNGAAATPLHQAVKSLATSSDVVMANATNRVDDPNQTRPARTDTGDALARHLEEDEDLRDWLTMTHYHDVELRNKKLKLYRERHRERLRRVQALEAEMKRIEAERQKLMEEAEAGLDFLWPTTTSATGVPVPSSAAPTPTDKDPNMSPEKEPTDLKREETAHAPAKRERPSGLTDTGDRPEKQPRIDEKPSNAGKPPSAPRTQDRGEIADRDSQVKNGNQSLGRPYPKSEDGRRSPPRRPREHSPHRVAAPDYRRRSDAGSPNDYRNGDYHGYRSDAESPRRTSKQQGPPTWFDVGGKGDTRYFIVKSWTDQNVYHCMEDGIWVTQQHNAAPLNRAFTQTKNVILFFSANQSRAFQGYARMISPTSPGNPQPKWVDSLHWACSNPFRVKWLSKTEVEFYKVGHLKNRLNEGRAVLVGKDGQEIDEVCGAELVREMYAIAQDKYERRDAALSFRTQ